MTTLDRLRATARRPGERPWSARAGCSSATSATACSRSATTRWPWSGLSWSASRCSPAAAPTCAMPLEGAGARLAAGSATRRAPSRSDARLVDLGEPDAIARATAADPKELTASRPPSPHWMSRRYRVAPEPISRLVQEAWEVGERADLDPTLILAIMAVESSFNPFAQSPVGAQGLMQVMTKVHDDKYEAFGGKPRRLRPGHQPARRRAGAEGMHRARRQPRRRPALLRRRGQPGRRRRLRRQGAGRAEHLRQVGRAGRCRCRPAPRRRWPTPPATTSRRWRPARSRSRARRPSERPIRRPRREQVALLR